MKRSKVRLVLIYALVLFIVGGTAAYLRLQQGSSFLPGKRTEQVAKMSFQQQGTKQAGLHFPPRPTLTPVPTPSPQPSPTAQPTTAPAVSNNVNTAAWTLIVNEDFAGGQLSSPWGTYNGPHGGGKSYYSPEEVHLQNGMLELAMERKSTGGMPYTTGGIGAFNLTQTYGKYEIRAKLPHGQGVGPYAGLWPKNGNSYIAFFESPGQNKEKIYFTNATGTGSGGGSITANGNFADAFHVFTCEWTPGKIRLLIDGVEQGVITNDVPNYPMWMAIAVESGDVLIGDPNESTVLPVSLSVDWVHIYKYNG